MKYEGDFNMGQKTGFGKYTYQGNTYEGHFLDGQFHGEGVYIDAKNKRTLEGTFKNNNLVKGKMISPDGSFYEGEYKNGMKNGSGVVTYPNGQVYVGTFENDKKHGLGTLFDLDKKTK